MTASDDELRASVNLGRRLTEEHQFEEAKVAFEEVLYCGDPRYEMLALLGIGTVSALTDRPHDAVAAYRSAVVRDANGACGELFDLGLFFEQVGYISQARDAYQVAFDNGDPRVRAYVANNLGDLLRESGDIAGARAVFEVALDCDDVDQSAMAATNLGVTSQLHGDMSGARSYYQRAIGSGRPMRVAAAAFNLGVLEEEEGDLDGAERAYRLALTKGAGPHAREAGRNRAALHSRRRNPFRDLRRALRRRGIVRPLDIIPMAILEEELLSYGVTRRAYRFLEDHPELCRNDTSWHLATTGMRASQRGNSVEAEHCANVAELLRDAATRGLDDAFSDFVRRSADRRLARSLLEDASAAVDEFTRTGSAAAIARVISVTEAMLEAIENGLRGLSKTGVLNHAGAAFSHHFDATADLAALDVAIDYWARALAENEADPSAELADMSMNYMMYGRWRRYHGRGELADLDEIVALAQQLADRTTINDEPDDHARYLFHLAAALRARHRAGGDAQDAARGREAEVRACAIVYKDPSAVERAATWLHEVYESSLDLVDLDRLLHVDECALAAADNPSDQLVFLQQLGVDARTAFDRIGKWEYLDQMTESLERAVELADDDYPELPSLLSSYGVAMRLRFIYRHDTQDLDRALTAHRRAVALAPELRADGLRGNLANTLSLRYKLTGDPSDLERAIELHEQEEKYLPVADSNGAPWRPHALGNLAYALRLRFELRHDPEDLRRALELEQWSLEHLPPASTRRPTHLASLGNILMTLSEATGDERMQREATDALDAGCAGLIDLKPTYALTLARDWGRQALSRASWDEADRAYRYATDAASRLLLVQAGRDRKEQSLLHSHGVNAEAAFVAAMTGDLPRAVVLAEQGRAQVLSETLATSQDRLDALAAAGHADLVERYRQLASQAETPASPTDGEVPTVASQPMLVTRLTAVVKEIRQIAGFSDFLLPWSFDEVREVTQRVGPLLYLVSTQDGGLALLVNDTVEVCWLPSLTNRLVQDEVIAYMGTLDARHTDPEAFRTKIDRLTRQLWPTVLGPILDMWPGLARATVISTGWLGLLPLHAAWVDDDSTPTGRRYALDQVLLTYSPNARVLDSATRRRREAASLLVIDTSDFGESSGLPHAAREAEMLVPMFEQAQRLHSEQATVQAVVAAMPDAGVVHFACHGYASSTHPLDSALILAGGEVLTLRSLLSANLSDVQLVTLSACETAMQTGIPDEAVSLSSGLLQSGAAGVVGSLWAVSDLSTMLLMNRFYYLWRKEGVERPQALRLAQQWLRDSTNSEKSIEFPDVSEISLPADAEQFASLWHNTRGHSHPYHWAAFSYVGV